MEDDFIHMYPAARDLLFHWSKYSNIIVKCMSEKIKDKSSLEILKKVKETSSMSEGGYS